jgi:hypothetical protein
MIDRTKFNLIKEKHGDYASWAVWAAGIHKPKENVGDLSVFNIEKNDTLLTQLNPNLVFVGLNISRRIEFSLAIFMTEDPVAWTTRLDTP